MMYLKLCFAAFTSCYLWTACTAYTVVGKDMPSLLRTHRLDQRTDPPKAGKTPVADYARDQGLAGEDFAKAAESEGSNVSIAVAAAGRAAANIAKKQGRDTEEVIRAVTEVAYDAAQAVNITKDKQVLFTSEAAGKAAFESAVKGGKSDDEVLELVVQTAGAAAASVNASLVLVADTVGKTSASTIIRQNRSAKVQEAIVGNAAGLWCQATELRGAAAGLAKMTAAAVARTAADLSAKQTLTSEQVLSAANSAAREAFSSIGIQVSSKIKLEIAAAAIAEAAAVWGIRRSWSSQRVKTAAAQAAAKVSGEVAVKVKAAGKAAASYAKRKNLPSVDAVGASIAAAFGVAKADLTPTSQSQLVDAIASSIATAGLHVSDMDAVGNAIGKASGNAAKDYAKDFSKTDSFAAKLASRLAVKAAASLAKTAGLSAKEQAEVACQAIVNLTHILPGNVVATIADEVRNLVFQLAQCDNANLEAKKAMAASVGKSVAALNAKEQLQQQAEAAADATVGAGLQFGLTWGESGEKARSVIRELAEAAGNTQVQAQGLANSIVDALTAAAQADASRSLIQSDGIIGSEAVGGAAYRDHLEHADQVMKQIDGSGAVQTIGASEVF
eukprot:TRINITY_DN23877_c0_g1_i1.p1 TRINITY_DN23877_c0_g1~~TRINITY_DN23877_c0_g1_i1.p1  ORF type:complete len:614 (-),score=146.94 TRINITY_DN23877_c0_g1_i1:25-1866(-)